MPNATRMAGKARARQGAPPPSAPPPAHRCPQSAAPWASQTCPGSSWWTAVGRGAGGAQACAAGSCQNKCGGRTEAAGPKQRILHCGRGLQTPYRQPGQHTAAWQAAAATPSCHSPAAGPSRRGGCTTGRGCPRPPACRPQHKNAQTEASASMGEAAQRLRCLAALDRPARLCPRLSPRMLPPLAMEPCPPAHLALLVLRADEQAVGLVAAARPKLHAGGAGPRGLHCVACARRQAAAAAGRWAAGRCWLRQAEAAYAEVAC